MHHQPNHPVQPGHPTTTDPTTAPTGEPMLARVSTAALLGVTARPVRVEVTISRGLPSVTIIGLGDTTAWTARDRVRAAIVNAGYPWPDRRITIQVTPSELPKPPGGLDLPVALGLLAAGGTLPPANLDRLWAVGELGLGGEVRPTDGVLPAVLAARDAGARMIVVPAANLAEAALAPPGIIILGARTLAQAVGWLRGTANLNIPDRQPPRPPAPGQDLASVPPTRPHERRGLEIAAAGGHHLLLAGPPGNPVRLLAACLPGLLPELTDDQALEVAQVYSAAGRLNVDNPRGTGRPFRAPHHTYAPATITGGGGPLRPGEVSLANHGVLYLEDLQEYPADLLAALRQPLRDGTVTVGDQRGTVRLPARFHLVVSSTPCYEPASGRRCAAGLDRLDHALSGLPRGRVEVAVTVNPWRTGSMSTPLGESTAAVRARVAAARARQHARGGGLNTDLLPAELAGTCVPTREAWRLAASTFGLAPDVSGPDVPTGDFHTVLRVARTIADLDDSDWLTADHVTEALGFLPATHTQEVSPSPDRDHQ